MREPFTLPAPGKLNLCLNISGRRADGYHELQTVFQLISEQDELSFELNDKLIVEGPNEIALSDNLVYKAAICLLALVEEKVETNAINLGAKIKLHKNLPMGAGIGGGSSDAATTLVGLNLLWNLKLSTAELMDIGRELGADVPVFVLGRSAWGEGIGEILSPLDLPSCHYLVIQPDCFISTAEIFSNSQLTRDSAPLTIARFLEDSSGNDCEAVARKIYPEVDQALIWLNNWGPAKMTGTGSCVFLEFGSREEAKAVEREVPEHWHAFVTEGLNESPLIKAAKFVSTFK